MYFVVALQDMVEFGGSDANSLKQAIDGVFDPDSERSNIPLVDYQTKLVSVTSDGAAVNMGIIKGAMTQLGESRPWLIKIHCISHRLELALKEGIKEFDKLNNIETIYTTIFYLLRNSGKLKTACKEAAKALNITWYTLPKIHGTRFISHRRRGLSKFLHNYPAIITAFLNGIAQGYKKEMVAKMKGVIKKMQSHKFLLNLCVYVDILESVSILSLQFERNLLMAFEVRLELEKALSRLEEMRDETEEEAIDSCIKKFSIKDEFDLVTLTAEYPKAGHERKKIGNQEYTEVELDTMTNIDVSN